MDNEKISVCQKLGGRRDDEYAENRGLLGSKITLSYYNGGYISSHICLNL